jgi:integrase/recombinase XerC
MRCTELVDLCLEQLREDGRLHSDATERAYRAVLMRHAADVQNRDPRRSTSREDVKRTLRRWRNPNTAANRLAILRSFYTWLEEEGMRRDNPARQVPRPRMRKSNTRRMTRQETARFLAAATGERERRTVYLGVLAGLRSKELRGLRGAHFDRKGFVRVEGSRARWVPIIPDLSPVVVGIRCTVRPNHYVIPREQSFRAGTVPHVRTWPEIPTSPQSIWRLVRRVGERAGLPNVHPQTMRYAFADYFGAVVVGAMA